MLILHYKTKKELRESVGQKLRFTETSCWGEEYSENGAVAGCNHPKRTWFATVEIENGLIKKVH